MKEFLFQSTKVCTELQLKSPTLILQIPGKLVQEIHQRYNSWVGQIIRLYMGQNHVELDWVVGPINVE